MKPDNPYKQRKIFSTKKNVTLILICLILASLKASAQQNTSPEHLIISQVAIATYKLAGIPDFLTADGNDAWVLNIDTMQKLSIKYKKPILNVAVPSACGAPVLGFGSLWVASCKKKSVYRINNVTGKIIAKIPTDISDAYGEISLAAGAGSIWILSDSMGILTRIDPNTNTIEKKIQVKPNSYCAVFGYNSVWITNTGANNSTGLGSVQRINPGTNSVESTISVGKIPRFLAAGENGIWILNQGDGTVSRIDPQTNKVVATIDAKVPGSGGDIDAGAGLVWVRAARGTFLLTINPNKNSIETAFFPLCGSGAVRVANKYTWVTAHDINTIWVLKNK
jgi:virginiamycin B lyase